MKKYKNKYLKKIKRLFNKEINKLYKIDTNYHNIYDEISLFNKICIFDIYEKNNNNKYLINDSYIEPMDNIRNNENYIDYMNRVYFNSESVIKLDKSVSINDYIMDNINEINKHKNFSAKEIRYRQVFSKLISKVLYLNKILYNKYKIIYEFIYKLYIENKIDIECINFITFEHKIICFYKKMNNKEKLNLTYIIKYFINIC